MKKLYIAYGHNLNKERMQRRCSQTANPIAVATLKDHRLVFQGRLNSARANVIHAKGFEVPVGVWEISDADEHRLDIYERVDEGLRTKKYVEIEVNGERKEALIYFMLPSPYGIPSDGYLKTIAEGYKDFNLPAIALNEAVALAYEKTVMNGSWIHTYENAVPGPAQ